MSEIVFWVDFVVKNMEHDIFVLSKENSMKKVDIEKKMERFVNFLSTINLFDEKLIDKKG